MSAERDNKETVADIVRKIRATEFSSVDGKFPLKRVNEIMCDIADRIEVAHKREIEELKNGK